MGKATQNILAGVVLVLVGLSASPRLSAQAASPAPAPAEQQTNADATRELLQAVRELKAEVGQLNTRLEQVSAAEAKSEAENQRLQEELAAVTQRIQSLEAPAKSTALTPISYQPPRPAPPQASPVTVDPGQAGHHESIEDQLARLEEKTDLLDAKVADQYQTKVESGSKYRLRLSGIFLLNLYGNTGSVDNQDFPEIAEETEPGVSDRAFGGSLRQSQINLEGFGPDLAGAHTSANLSVDFAGNLLEESNGAWMGGVRLRTGVFRMDWANTSLVAGQDALFFVPLSPTSLASLAVPAMSYSGNLWGWTPQVRVEHRFALAGDSQVTVAAGILDQLTGDTPSPGQERDPSWGEQSGQPGYAAHIGWSKKTANGIWGIGAGGYYGRQYWGFNRGVDGWAGTVDLRVPLNRYFEFSAAYYRGRSVGGFGGGVGQTVLFNGDPGLASTSVYGLNSQGGWAQLTFKPRQDFSLNAAFGQDNPFASQLRLYPVVPSEYEEPLLKNQSWFVNGIYQLRSNILFSVEFRRYATNDLGPDRYFANSANLSLGYLF